MAGGESTAGDIDVLQGIPADARWRLNEFEALKARAVERDLGGSTVYVAALDDIVASKRISGRPADIEALPELEALGEAAPGPQAPPPAPGATLGPAGYPQPASVAQPELGMER